MEALMIREKLRVGIIGVNPNYGWSRASHLPALLALPDFELAAVCTAHQDTAELSAKHYGAPLAFHDYHEMVIHPDIDLFVVSVRAPLHHAIVMTVLRAERHVYCEWPLGANLAEAEEIASLANSKNVRNMIGLQARGDPALLRLRELLAEGYVGDVVSCNMTMFLPGILNRGITQPWSADRHKGANGFTIAGGHAIDVLSYCVGEFRELSARVSVQVPVWKTAEANRAVDVTSPDNVLVNGFLKNGAIASVHVAVVPWFGSGWRLEVYGLNGTLVASSKEMVQYAQIRLQGGQANDAALREMPIPDRLTWVPGEVPSGRPFNVAQMYRKLGQAIRDEKDAHPDFNLALNRHRLLDAIQRSSDHGTRLNVA
jgi:predicted dehydrogenase